MCGVPARFLTASAAPFASLGTRNFRIYFACQLISQTGTWMQNVALAWLVLQLTNSGLMLGVVGALQFLPLMLGGMWGGLLADRADKRLLLVATQTGMALIAAALAALTLTGAVRLWSVLALAFLLGCVTLVDNPTRLAFVVELVAQRQVANAVGLDSAMLHAARAVGPAIAGIVIPLFGPGWCFLANACSYLVVIGGLALLRAADLRRRHPQSRSRGQLRAGLRYVWDSAELRATSILVAVAGTLAFNFAVVLPLLAKRSFHGDAEVFGLMTAMTGVGALAGALMAAASRRPRRLLVAAGLSLGLSMLAAAVIPLLAAELAMLVVVGASAIAFIASAKTVLQLRSSDEMQGRVMAVFSIVFVGSTPVGGPLVGWISQQWGARVGFVVGGLAVAAATLGWRRSVAALGPDRHAEPSQALANLEPGPSAGTASPEV